MTRADCRKGETDEVSPATPATSNRVARSFACRLASAGQDAFMSAPQQIENGDEARYADKSGTYTKGILQQAGAAGIGLVDLMAYQTFKKALSTGDPADFETIKVGGTGVPGNDMRFPFDYFTENDPQGGLAFDLDCPDGAQFTSPPAPAVVTEDYATELVEMYWASLLRDVAFTDYPTHPTAKDAAAELSSLPCYKGPRDGSGNVTPELLFRGGLADSTFADETVGPYMSQFLLQKTTMGVFPVDQKYTTNKKGVDYMLDPTTFQQVQNGQKTGLQLEPVSPPLYLHDGRGLAALTHADVLYQEFLWAYLLLDSLKVPLNPGNPYGSQPHGSKTQNGFNTFGQPDIASTLAHVANEALNVVWYQKWYVHLRHRPESGGALVYRHKQGSPPPGLAKPSNTVLNSNAVKKSFTTNNSYFLSQAFPEGSPYHPAYPTGHGTVAGACITVLKFFFNGDLPWSWPIVVSTDGSTLTPYTGSDAGKLTVNGELHKLAHNVSFGHGIHAGIHWRSDTDTSIQLGEAVALSILQDRAHTYNIKFTVKLTKVDGSTATISNQ
jgi:hypothetical protein